MVRPFDFGRVELSADLGSARGVPRGVQRDDTPFLVVLLGDFSGGQRSGNLADRPMLTVDRDNLDQVMAKLAPAIRLPMEGGEALSLRFRELEDFHPDRLFENAEIFRRLRELRRRVADPATFGAAAQELGLGAAPQLPAHTGAAASAASVAAGLVERKGSLLDDVIEEAESGGTRPSRRPDELQEFVQRVTRPHLVAQGDARQADVLRMIDGALSAQMRALLHVPALQALEAAWRAINLLVRRVETGTQLKLYLVDITKEELAADLLSSPDLRQTKIYKLLVEKTVGTPGADVFSLLMGNYTFGADRDDVEVLRRLANIAQSAGAPFVAGASPRLLGCASIADTPHPREWKAPLQPEVAEAWDTLRRSPEAAWIGLALPRFLLRLPYGKDTDPIESFDFEEMPGTPEHEDYLWGNPAFACALLLAQSFSDDGWQMRPGTHSEIDRLPLHIYKHDGESELKPCAETLLTEEAAQKMLECGLMPLVSLKERDAVKLVRFQAIAEPLRSLHGSWSR
jgi:type VI secretion system protein ImpC